MSARRKVPAAPARDISHLVTDTTRAGEITRIFGEQGRWRITAQVLNVNNGAEWVELMGPLDTKGRATHGFRAVRPEKLRGAR